MPERPDLEAAVERLKLWAGPESDAGIVLARLEELEAERSELRKRSFNDGVAAVVTMRCTRHRYVPQYNANTPVDAECATCAVEAAEADARAMREAAIPILNQWHGNWKLELPNASHYRKLGAAALRGWSPSWYRA